eukprot:Gb_12641 [translate_table: standard]
MISCFCSNCPAGSPLQPGSNLTRFLVFCALESTAPPVASLSPDSIFSWSSFCFCLPFMMDLTSIPGFISCKGKLPDFFCVAIPLVSFTNALLSFPSFSSPSLSSLAG